MTNILGKSFLAGALLFPAAFATAQSPLEIRNPDLGLSKSVTERLASAVLKMENTAEESFCSAFAVSPDGYLLTALHCVRGCLLQNDAMEQGSNTYIGLHRLAVVKNPRGPRVTCEGFSFPGASGLQGPVQIVATGSALSIFDSRFFSSHAGLYNELKSKGWEKRAHDFALLKVQAAKALTCLELDSSSSLPNLEIFAVGFPVASDSKDVSRTVLSASRGSVFAQVERSYYYQGLKTEIDRAMTLELFPPQDVIVSNAANKFGQSGGPIISAAGRVVGITSAFLNTVSGKNNETHELIGVSINHIQNTLPAPILKDLAKKNGACR